MNNLGKPTPFWGIPMHGTPWSLTRLQQQLAGLAAEPLDEAVELEAGVQWEKFMEICRTYIGNI